MSMEPRVIDLGNQETSTRSCVTSFGQGISIYMCANWTDKPAGAPDTQGTLITVAYNNSGNEMGTRWVWAHQYFMSPFVTYPWVRMGSSEVLTEWTPINRADIPPSNPNLLINPDFKINQRGFVSGSDVPAFTYTIDRWCADNTASNISVTSNGLKIQNLSNTTFATISQPIEHLNQGTYTLSVCISEFINADHVTARIHTYDNTLNQFSNSNTTSIGVYTTTFNLDADYDNVYIEIYSVGDGGTIYSFTLKWVKLEVGPVATQFVPPDPATELLKCQRYYFALNGPNENVDNAIYGIVSNVNWLLLGYTFKTEMYRTPDITITYLASWDSININQYAIAVPHAHTKNGLPWLFSANGYFVEGNKYFVRFIADAEI